MPAIHVKHGAWRALAASMPRPDRPMGARDGVTPSCIALAPGPWRSVLDFLCDRFPRVGTEEWERRLREGDVAHDDGTAVAIDEPYRPHRRLHYYRRVAQEAPVPFDQQVLYRDEHLVVIDKPHFLPVIPGGRYLAETVLVRARRALGLDSLAPLHRLDRETAGVVVLGVRPCDRAAYHALFRERRVHKEYEAIAAHRPDLPLPAVRASRLQESSAAFMQMEEVQGEPNAVTGMACLGPCGPGLARYRLEPRTGQRHQLRVHLAAVGRPILHDQIYPVLQPHAADPAGIDFIRPLQLLARTVAFQDPITGEARWFQSLRNLAAGEVGHDARSNKETSRDL